MSSSHRTGIYIFIAALCCLAALIASFSPLSPDTHAETAARSRCNGAEINLNFSDAELNVVIEAISKATQKRFIVHAAPPGAKVTIISPEPVCPDEAYEAFLSALSAGGLAVVKQGSFYIVTTAAKAVRSDIPIVVDDE